MGEEQPSDRHRQIGSLHYKSFERRVCVNPETVPCPGNPDKNCRGDIGMIWSLGFARGSDPFSLRFEGPIQTGQDASVDGSRVLFVADPFLHVTRNTWYIFSEALDNVCQKGDIAVHWSENEGHRWQYGGIILSERWHLSFPYVIHHGENFYMITCATAGADVPYSIWLYTTETFPTGWRRHSRILINQTVGHAIDPVLFYHERVWYLFLLDDGIGKERIFYSDSILGPFVEHQISKVFSIRQSGKIIKDSTGQLWAFHHTGQIVERWNIKTLSKTKFEYGIKHKLLQPLDATWARSGMHTFNAVQLGDNDWAVAVDGYWYDEESKTYHCLESNRTTCP